MICFLCVHLSLNIRYYFFFWKTDTLVTPRLDLCFNWPVKLKKNFLAKTNIDRKQIPALNSFAEARLDTFSCSYEKPAWIQLYCIVAVKRKGGHLTLWMVTLPGTGLDVVPPESPSSQRWQGGEMNPELSPRMDIPGDTLFTIKRWFCWFCLFWWFCFKTVPR